MTKHWRGHQRRQPEKDKTSTSPAKRRLKVKITMPSSITPAVSRLVAVESERARGTPTPPMPILAPVSPSRNLSSAQWERHPLPGTLSVHSDDLNLSLLNQTLHFRHLILLLSPLCSRYLSSRFSHRYASPRQLFMSDQVT